MEPRLSGRSNKTRQAKLSANGWLNGGKYGLAANEPAINKSWMSGIGSSAVVLTKPVMPPGSSVAKPLPREQALPQRQQQSVGPHVAQERAFVAAAI